MDQLSRLGESKYHHKAVNQIMSGEQSLLFDETVNIRILTAGVQTSDDGVGDIEGVTSENFRSDFPAGEINTGLTDKADTTLRAT